LTQEVQPVTQELQEGEGRDAMYPKSLTLKEEDGRDAIAGAIAQDRHSEVRD
jgi:hypothetical protein